MNGTGRNSMNDAAAGTRGKEHSLPLISKDIRFFSNRSVSQPRMKSDLLDRLLDLKIECTISHTSRSHNEMEQKPCVSSLFIPLKAVLIKKSTIKFSDIPPVERKRSDRTFAILIKNDIP